MKLIRKFWQWLYDSTPGQSYAAHKAEGEVKSVALGAILALVIGIIIYVVIELDAYFRNHF